MEVTGEKAYICPACDGTEKSSADPYNDYAMVQCRRCSLLHTLERDFPVAQYDDVYASQSAYREMIEVARRTYAGELGYRNLWWFKRLALRRLEKNGKGRLLDVGCGPGTFVLVARQRGWEVAGIEPTTEPAKLARTFGLEVFNGIVEDFARQSPARFNAITSFEVIEHVIQPLAMLRTMSELLEPGGQILVSVPNLDDPYCIKQQIPSAVPPVHINFFNRRSLGEAMRAAGLEVLKFTSLPIPSSSVRNVHGRNGFAVRAPLLLAMHLFGRADGTTLVALARKN